MGMMSLDEYREELTRLFGDRGVDNTRLDRWVNLALISLAGTLRFEELRCLKTFTTVAGVYLYALPSDFVAYITVTDTTNQHRLKRLQDTDTTNFLTDEDYWGQPLKWGRRKNSLVLYPPPDDAYVIREYYVQQPVKMILGTDVSPFPAVWDEAILLLAQNKGHLAFRELDLAKEVYGRAISHIRSIKTESEWQEGNSPAAGLQVAWDESDLQDQQEG